MQALVLNRYNGPLELSEVPRPKPSAGQVLVRIAASGLNPLDTKIRSGSAAHAKHPVPLVLGIDLAGVVEEVGPGVTTFKVSEGVYGMTGGVGGIQGSLAQYAAVDADLLALKPSNLTMREAAALPLAFFTSYSGIVDRAHYLRFWLQRLRVCDPSFQIRRVVRESIASDQTAAAMCVKSGATVPPACVPRIS